MNQISLYQTINKSLLEQSDNQTCVGVSSDIAWEPLQYKDVFVPI